VWIALAHAQVTTSQYNNARTGAYLDETTLTPQNVNVRPNLERYSHSPWTATFTRSLSTWPGLDIPGKGRHNVLFVATEHNSVYAFDADALAPPLWQVSFINPPDAGITTLTETRSAMPVHLAGNRHHASPVIDASTGTLYVLARTKESDHYYQRLHALDVTTGAENSAGRLPSRRR